MDTGPRSLPPRLLIALVLLGLLSPAPARTAPALPVAVRDDRCTFVLATAQADEQYYLVIGSLARQGGPFRVRIQTEASAGPEAIPLEPAATDLSWARRVQELNARLARARQQQSAPAVEQAPAAPPSQKVFHVLTGAGGLQDPANYTAVVADLRAVGRSCQVYVDRAHPDAVSLQSVVEDAVRAFDDEIYPKMANLLGRALDVDRDGRFTLLFSPWLGKLQHGKVAVDGFVRGSDFYRDLAAPFSNRCDMMYLSTSLRPGPHLRTILAHEYTHAVIFCEHVMATYLPEVSPRAEESWLDEGLSHLAEDAGGYSWSNLDYRISAFLNSPERYPLVVADYYGSGRWRDPGTRGAAYLFLRWCRDTYGAGLPTRLTQSNLAGVTNLETATEEHFAELFRRWSVALLEKEAWATGSDEARAAAPPFGRLLCGPRVAEMSLAGAEQEIQLAGTAAAYVLLCAPNSSHARVAVTAERGTELQVSLVRLPLPAPRLRLRVESLPGATAVRLVLTAQGGALELQDAAWERLNPQGKANNDTSYRPSAARLQTIRSWFGDSALRAGETRSSTIIPLPASTGPWVWKVVGKDAAGHAVSCCVLQDQ